MENAMFGLSRLYVPTQFFLLYKRGVFGEQFTFGEFRYIMKVMVFMHLIDCAGHMIMRKWCQPLYEKHIGYDEEAFYSKKRQMDDYIIQKNYFKNKKDGKAGV